MHGDGLQHACTAELWNAKPKGCGMQRCRVLRWVPPIAPNLTSSTCCCPALPRSPPQQARWASRRG